MSRAERLLGLMQALRRWRAPVTGAALGEELGVSLRTLSATLDWPSLLAGVGRMAESEAVALPIVREALMKERKLAFAYSDKQGRETSRVAWDDQLEVGAESVSALREIECN